MSTSNTLSVATLDTIIDRTITTIDKGIDRHVGDMTLMQAMEVIGALMDLRDRQHLHMQSIKRCASACVKKPKRNETNGL